MSITIDGPYTTATRIARVPQLSDIPERHHYIWRETFAVLKSNYYPLQVGTLHPEGLEDPYDDSVTSGSNFFELTSGGQGRPLYLIQEEIQQYIGTTVIFNRFYTSIPDEWTETETGYYTFPGFLAIDGEIIRKTVSNPVLIRNTYTYQLGAPQTLSQFDSKNYTITVNGSSAEYNWIEFVGSGYDDNGDLGLVTADSQPVIDIQVSRWNGDIFQVKHRQVLERL